MEGYNSVGKNNVSIFLTKSICMKKSENYLSRKLKEHLILNVQQLNAFNYWTELEYSENSTHATLRETSIYFKLNQCNLSLLKPKFFKNGYSYIFHKEIKASDTLNPIPSASFAIKERLKRGPGRLLRLQV